MSQRFSTELKFISTLDEHAGHSWLASVTQSQSRQSVARASGIMDDFEIVVMVVFRPLVSVSENVSKRLLEAQVTIVPNDRSELTASF